jgi:hypothetical protein
MCLHNSSPGNRLSADAADWNIPVESAGIKPEQDANKSERESETLFFQCVAARED